MTTVSHNPVFREWMKDRSRLPTGETDGLRQFRAAAFDRFEKMGFPTREWESWRYMNLLPLLDSSFQSPAKPPAEKIRGRFPCLETFPLRAVFADGVFIPELSTGTLALEPLEAALQKITGPLPGLQKLMEVEENPFALLSMAHGTEGLWIHLAPDQSVPQILHVFFLQQEPVAAMPRLAIRLESGAKLELAVHSLDTEAASLLNLSVDVHLGRNASLKLVQSHRAGNHAYVFTTLRALQEEGSRLDQVVFHRGGKMARTDARVDLAGREASCSLNGLGLLDGTSQLFQEVSVHHRVPHTTSRQFYKSLLGGSSQSEFNSLAHVYPGAVKSEAHQLNRNLLLSDSARAYSRPKLKIYTDDVSASHGSANGQTQKQELFYLRSRGLDEKTARFILTFGFAEEILQEITDAGIRQALEADVRAALETMLDRKPAGETC